MKTPDKIYVNKKEIELTADNLVGLAWKAPFDKTPYEEYIRKDILLEWAKEMLHKIEVKSNDGDVFAQGMHAGFGAIISKITNL